MSGSSKSASKTFKIKVETALLKSPILQEEGISLKTKKEEEVNP